MSFNLKIAIVLFVACVNFSAHAEGTRYERIRHEFSPLLGLYTGDVLRSAIFGGATYTLRWSSDVWFGADFQMGEVEVDRQNGLGLTSDDRFLLVDGALSWNIPALLGATLSDPKSGYASDFYTTLGAGKIWLGSRSAPVVIVGGGLVLHLPVHPLAIRFDLKGLFYSLSNANGSSMTVDSLLSLGPSFIF